MNPQEHSRGSVEIKRVYKSFGDLEVLKDISLRCDGGETTCIIGPSGSGKSTLLRCVNQLETPDRGYVQVDGEVIGYERHSRGLRKSTHRVLEKQRLQIGMVFQRFNLFPHMTALENVAIGPRQLLGYSKQKALETATHYLDRVGMSARKNAYARQLSGGQQQRVGIARALAMNPKVLLFDEPTSALDPELVGEVLEVMRGVASQGITMLVVTHELTFAREVASRVVFMDRGTVVESGTADQVLLSPREERTASFVSRVYGESGSHSGA